MNSYSCCSNLRIKSKKITSSSRLLKLVAEESRLKLLCILKEKEHCVCEIMRHVDLSQSLISHHLKDLKEEKVVNCKKKGLFTYYSLTNKGKHIINLLLKI